MATTLWPIIHRLAGLRALKTELETAVHTNQAPSKIAVLRTEFESTAQAIEAALLQWHPQLPPGFTPADDDMDIDLDDLGPIITTPQPDDTNPPNPPTDPDSTPLPDPSTPPLPTSEHSRISSIHHNALAYRHASLVYLYRTVLSHARTHPTVQSHTRLALSHCVSTVKHKGPMSALLWPLFVSACEAVTERDRRLAEQAFVEVDRRQGMRNIERAWGIVREVWRREDATSVGEGSSCEAGLEGGVVGGGGGGGVGDVNGGGEEVEVERVVIGGGGGGMGTGCGGEEMWRRVCREMGVSIVFG
jgi:hypothetical protein